MRHRDTEAQRGKSKYFIPLCLRVSVAYCICQRDYRTVAKSGGCWGMTMRLHNLPVGASLARKELCSNDSHAQAHLVVGPSPHFGATHRQGILGSPREAERRQRGIEAGAAAAPLIRRRTAQ